MPLGLSDSIICRAGIARPVIFWYWYYQMYFGYQILEEVYYLEWRDQGRTVRVDDFAFWRGNFIGRTPPLTLICFYHSVYSPLSKSSAYLSGCTGGWEGGQILTTPLIGEIKAFNYAFFQRSANYFWWSPMLLVPQSPTFWMQSGWGNDKRAVSDVIFTKAVMSLVFKIM